MAKTSLHCTCLPTRFRPGASGPAHCAAKQLLVSTCSSARTKQLKLNQLGVDQPDGVPAYRAVNRARTAYAQCYCTPPRAKFAKTARFFLSRVFQRLLGLAGAAPMRSPPSHVDSGDSHASRSPPLKREDGGKKVNDETNTVLSYRNCNFSLCAVAAPPACTHLLSRSHDAPRASQTPAERGNHQPARQPSRLARAVGECSCDTTPRLANLVCHAVASAPDPIRARVVCGRE